MAQDPVVVYYAANSQQAQLLQAALTEAGIEARVESPADNHLGHYELSNAPRIVVRREDAEDARQIAAEFDQLLMLPPQEDAMPDSEPAASGDVIDAWPNCPACETARTAECVACGAAASFFPPAYQQAGEANGLRMCPSCDDVFEPRYFRQCHRCGHDFGDGVVPEPVPHYEDESRAWKLLWVMLGGMAPITAYFAWVFRR